MLIAMALGSQTLPGNAVSRSTSPNAIRAADCTCENFALRQREGVFVSLVPQVYV